MTRPETDTVKTGSKSRKAVTLNDSLERRILAYALAAGAVIFGAARPAEANTIVYTPTFTPMGPGNTLSLDLNHDGVGDFTFQTEFHISSSSFFQRSSRRLDVSGDLAGNSVMGSGPLVLTTGAYIGPSQAFQQSAFMAGAAETRRIVLPSYHSSSSSGSWGNWRNANGFLGLRFQIGGKTHYGWAQLWVYANPFDAEVIPVLEGSAGLAFWRKKKAAASN
jgi:hypothetical protein